MLPAWKPHSAMTARKKQTTVNDNLTKLDKH